VKLYDIASKGQFLRWRISVWAETNIERENVPAMQKWCIEQFYDSTRDKEHQPYDFGTSSNFYFEKHEHAAWFVLRWRK